MIKNKPSAFALDPQDTDNSYLENNNSSKSTTALVAFLLQEVGAREKLTKENAEKGISRSAEREEGYAPSTAPPFEKGGRKLFFILTVLTPLSAN